MSKRALCFLALLAASLHASPAAVLLSDDRPIRLRLDAQPVRRFTASSESVLLVTSEGLQLGPAHSPDPTQVFVVTSPTTIDTGFVNNGTVIAPVHPGETLTLTGAVRGAGSFTGNVAFTGSYSPGNSPATVTLDSPTFGPFNVLTMELGGTLQGTEYDHLIFTGTATFGGTLDVVLINGFNPAPGHSFDLFDGNTTGSFATINLPALDPGLSWNTTQFASDGILIVVPEPHAATLAIVGLLSLASTRRVRR
jgi:hypothetical protein